MRIRSIVAIVLLAAGMSFTLPGAAVAQDEIVINVGSQETFSTIQAAVNDPQTERGDTLIVGAGTYPGDITVDVPNLTLSGPNSRAPGRSNRGVEAVIKGTVTLTKGADLKGFKVSVDGAKPAIRITDATSPSVVKNNVVDHDGVASAVEVYSGGTPR